MKKFKKLLCFVGAAILTFGIAACSGGGSGTGGGDVYEDDGVAIAAPAGTETTVTVCLNTGINPADVGYADVALRSALSKLTTTTTLANGLFQYRYTKMLHNDAISAGVRLKFEDYGWGEPLIQKLGAAFASGRGPDVITGETQISAYMKQGYLEPFPEELAAYVRENMHPLAYSAMTDENGNIYGVAPCASIPVLIWNKELLTSAGVPDEIVENGVDTWEEWLGVGRTLRKKNMYMGGIYCGSNFGGYLRSTPFIYMAGGALVNEENKAAFVSENNKTALEFLRSMSELNLLGIMASNTEDVFYNYFNGKRMGYLVEGSWRIRQAKDLGIDVGFCALPTMNAGEKSKNVAIGATYMSVPKYSGNKEAAFKAIRCYIGEASQRVVAESDLRPCTYLPIADGEAYATMSPVQSKVYEILKNETDVMQLPAFSSGQEQFWEAWSSALTGTVYWEYGTDAPDIMGLLQSAQAKTSNLY